MSNHGGILLAAINAKWIHPSLALRLLKANLGSLEDECIILEFALRQPLKEKVEPILAAQPRILGLSVSIWNHKATLELLEKLNIEWEKNIENKAGLDSNTVSRPIVVLGGPEVSWLPENREIFRYADYVIRGEGEESFRNLCQQLFSSAGIAHPEGSLSNANHRTLFINRGNTIVDVKTNASPYRLYTEDDLKRKLIYVEASRGCPFTCDFCLGPARTGIPDTDKSDASEFDTGKPGIFYPGISFVQETPLTPTDPKPAQVREFPLEPFLTEMGSLIDSGVRQFKFLDRTFNLNTARAKKIMEFFLARIDDQLIANAKKSPLCVHFEIFPLPLPHDLKELLVRFPPGSLRLELGIQTFNPQTSSLINRSGTPESAEKQTREALETLRFLGRETNAIIHADLIAGLPGETIASFGAGFDLLWQTLSTAGSSFEIQLGILKCLPGTPIVRHNETHDMKYSSDPPYEVIRTAAISAAELTQLKNFARFWEIIVNRNPFPQFISRFVPSGVCVFERFMALSESLFRKFERNWGIDRSHLKDFLFEYFKIE